jgi:hypothetical protein
MVETSPNDAPPPLSEGDSAALPSSDSGPHGDSISSAGSIRSGLGVISGASARVVVIGAAVNDETRETVGSAVGTH